AAFVAVFLLVAPRWRSTVALIGAIFSATVGVATFLAGWHRPAAMVAAYLVRGIWTLIGGFVIFRVSKEWNVISRRSRAEYVGVAEIILWFIVVIGLGGAVVVLLVSSGPAGLPFSLDGFAPLPRWFVFGALLVGGSASLVFGLLASFFRGDA